MNISKIRQGLLLIALTGAAAVAGCDGGSAVSVAGNGAAEQSQAGLDLIPLTISQGAEVHRFTVEVARTSEEQAQGLMFRTELDADRGMLFPFPQPKTAAFWMRNTLIPLDMIFVRADGSIDRIAENTVPQDESPVASGGEVSAVLELAGGTTARLGIDESATVRWTSAGTPR
jgi:hypothetical protein